MVTRCALVAGVAAFVQFVQQGDDDDEAQEPHHPTHRPQDNLQGLLILRVVWLVNNHPCNYNQLR